MPFCCPNFWEKYRVSFQGVRGDDTNGAIIIPAQGLKIIFSNQLGWEHVSVSRKNKVPSYDDMDRVKRAFWDDDQCVMQLHVPRQDHVNCHPFCLHLWRPTKGKKIPRPPRILVGPAGE